MIFGDYYKSISERTLPHVEAYARKHGVPLRIINERKISNSNSYSHVCWEKYQVADLLKEYDAVLFVDIDCIVKPDCCNLFDAYQGGFSALIWEDNPSHEMRRFAELLGYDFHPLLDMNSGVWLIRRSHKALLDLPESIPDPSIHVIGEQCWFSIRLMETKLNWECLEPKHNCMDPTHEWEIFHAVLYKGPLKLRSLQQVSQLLLSVKML